MSTIVCKFALILLILVLNDVSISAMKDISGYYSIEATSKSTGLVSRNGNLLSMEVLSTKTTNMIGIYNNITKTGWLSFPDDETYYFSFDSLNGIISFNSTKQWNKKDISGVYLLPSNDVAIIRRITNDNALQIHITNGVDAYGTYNDPIYPNKYGLGNIVFPDDTSYTAYYYDDQIVLRKTKGIFSGLSSIAFSIGIQGQLQRDLDDDHYPMYEDIINIIHQNSSIPIRQSITLSGNDIVPCGYIDIAFAEMGLQAVCIRIFMNNWTNNMEQDDEAQYIAHILDDFILRGHYNETVKVEVVFEIDEDGVLYVEITDDINGQTKHLPITEDSRHPIIWQKYENRLVVETLASKKKLQSAVRNLNIRIKYDDDYRNVYKGSLQWLSDEEYDILDEVIDEFFQWIQSNPQATIARYQDKQIEWNEIVRPILKDEFEVGDHDRRPRLYSLDLMGRSDV